MPMLYGLLDKCDDDAQCTHVELARIRFGQVYDHLERTIAYEPSQKQLMRWAICRDGSGQISDSILSEKSPYLDLPDKTGKTLINHAIIEDCAQSVKLLLKHGANAHKGERYSHYNIPLDVISRKALYHEATPETLDILFSLIEYGVIDVQKVRQLDPPYLEYLLSRAFFYPKSRYFSQDQALIDHYIRLKLPIDARAQNGATGLLLAMQSGYLDVARKLLAAGADPSLRDNNHQSALKYLQIDSQQRELLKEFGY